MTIVQSSLDHQPRESRSYTENRCWWVQLFQWWSTVGQRAADSFILSQDSFSASICPQKTQSWTEHEASWPQRHAVGCSPQVGQLIYPLCQKRTRVCRFSLCAEVSCALEWYSSKWCPSWAKTAGTRWRDTFLPSCSDVTVEFSSFYTREIWTCSEFWPLLKNLS